MITVEQWTGEEALLLQSVKRQGVREFAHRLGISPRTVSHWKQNRATVCQPRMAQILDMTLSQCTEEEKEAFRVRLANLRGEPVDAHRGGEAKPSPCTVISHKFLPAYIGDAVGPLYEAGVTKHPGPGGLEQRIMELRHPSAHSSTLHIYACGIAVLHLEEHRRVDSLTDLSLWRYRSYAKDRAWAANALASLLTRHVPGQPPNPAPSPEYVLSAYELREHSWATEGLNTALQLLATPSVLVDRKDPTNVRPLAPGVEDSKFQVRWTHPEAMSFDGGVSRGVATWSGVSYHPRIDERALTMSEIVALELDVQALWALSSHILSMVEDGHDPVMPEAFGWRFLRGAYFRLTASRPTETAQHRVMREAILATSELPARLRAAQEALREGSS